MSPAVLEAGRGTRGRDLGQSSLFDDLRRAAPSPPSEDRRPLPGSAEAGPAPACDEHDACSGGGGLMLEEHLERTWEDLLAAGAADCPVCAGELESTGGDGACRECGSALS